MILQNNSYDVTVIGSGYVGLVAACCLAKLKKTVCCADINSEKIEKLKNKTSPFFEPGLPELLSDAVDAKLIEFTDKIEDAIQKSEIIFVAVNTPSSETGEADISAVKAVAKTIAKNLTSYKIICLKSTVPIGTHKLVEDIINKEKTNNTAFDIVSIPEFLREGSAIYDFLNPNRIIIGAKKREVFEKVKALFTGVNVADDNIIWTNNLSAETIKYAANSFLALKISFINEISRFCDKSDIDTMAVAKGIGLDARIGNQFLNPGPGFGGSCFPKDVKALISMADKIGVDLKLVKDTLLVNSLQKQSVVERLNELLGYSRTDQSEPKNNLKDKNIAVLGLAFKANTDDIRESAAIDIIKHLVTHGANVKAYDPQANNNMKQEIPDITYCDNLKDAVSNSDAILILTEWQEFKDLDLSDIKNLVAHRVIFDTRNIINHEHAAKNGFVYDAIGRHYLLQK